MEFSVRSWKEIIPDKYSVYKEFAKAMGVDKATFDETSIPYAECLILHKAGKVFTIVAGCDDPDGLLNIETAEPKADPDVKPYEYSTEC